MTCCVIIITTILTRCNIALIFTDDESRKDEAGRRNEDGSEIKNQNEIGGAAGTETRRTLFVLCTAGTETRR